MKPLMLASTPVLGQAGPRLPLDDSEKAPAGWKYVGGEEFPGARGSLALDAAVAPGGKSSYRLEADFTGGGWPIDKAVSPSYMHVDNVQAYARK